MPMVTILPRLEPGERILERTALREFDPQRTIVFATKLGKIKQTRLDAFKRPNVRGIRAIALNDGDELGEARIADGDPEVILASAGGPATGLSLGEGRAMGPTAADVGGRRPLD